MEPLVLSWFQIYCKIHQQRHEIQAAYSEVHNYKSNNKFILLYVHASSTQLKSGHTVIIDSISDHYSPKRSAESDKVELQLKETFFKQLIFTSACY